MGFNLCHYNYSSNHRILGDNMKLANLPLIPIIIMFPELIISVISGLLIPNLIIFEYSIIAMITTFLIFILTLMLYDFYG